MRFFGLGTAVSAANVDQTSNLWSLVGDLQREKKDLCRERDMWREKYLLVTGQGNYTYPPPPSGEEKEEEDLGPIGRHVSIMGLKARSEMAARERAKELAKEMKSNDAA